MTRYINRSGVSGITHFEIGENHIDIKYKDNPTVYRYFRTTIGDFHLGKMKQFAVLGQGLGQYINQNAVIRDNFEKL